MNTYLAAVVFMYEVSLDRVLNSKQVPYMRIPKRLPMSKMVKFSSSTKVS